MDDPVLAGIMAFVCGLALGVAATITVGRAQQLLTQGPRTTKPPPTTTVGGGFRAPGGGDARSGTRLGGRKDALGVQD